MTQSAPLTDTVRTNLLDLDRAGLEAFFLGQGEKAFRAAQVLQWVHQYGVLEFAAMTNLSKALRAHLAEVAELRVPEVVTEQLSADGTRKWLLRLEGGNCVETVFIPEEGRGTLCVSSQVGCALDCSFCATARQGFNRNLSAGEIIGQVWQARQRLEAATSEARTITNVVLMGMGEPLLNLENVVRATNLMMDDLAYGLSKRRVTLSTAGVVPALERLAELSDVSLAVSLHAPNDELRSQLVPINRKYPIRDLLAACRRYLGEDQRRRVTFEYVLLAGVNDAPEQAHALARLLRGVPAKVNLIPFNPFPGAPYGCPDPATVHQFWEILTVAGYTATIRKTRGADIAAACGQLVGQVHDRTRRSQRLLAVEGGSNR